MVAVQQLNSITHVIFDLDGVIIDSERQYSIANSEALGIYGKIFTPDMKAAQMGRKKEESVRILLELNGLEKTISVENYLNHYDKLLQNLIPSSAELPGVSRLIDHFYSKNVPLAICTGSNKEEFMLKTRNYNNTDGWLKKIPIQVLTGSDPEVKFGKPHPDAYLVTMNRFQKRPAKPSDVLVFEDSINGVKSALQAGCTVIMVPQEEFLPNNWKEVKEELEPQLAEILKSLEEFDPVKYGLPAFP